MSENRLVKALRMSKELLEILALKVEKAILRCLQEAAVWQQGPAVQGYWLLQKNLPTILSHIEH